MVLKSIRSSPRVAAMFSQTVHSTALEVDRAPQGFIDIEWSSHGAADPRTNAFVDTTKAIIPGGDPHFGSSTWVSDGSLVYLPCDTSWILIGEKPCLAYPAQSGTASGSPSLTFLRYASGPVARLGERKIDGVETNGYRVSVPVSALVQSVVASERSLAQYEDLTISNVHVEVWSDERWPATTVGFHLPRPPSHSVSGTACLTEGTAQLQHYPPEGERSEPEHSDRCPQFECGPPSRKSVPECAGRLLQADVRTLNGFGAC